MIAAPGLRESRTTPELIALSLCEGDPPGREMSSDSQLDWRTSTIPKGLQPIAGGRAQRTPPVRSLYEPAYPEGITALGTALTLHIAGLPPGDKAFIARDPVVFAALDHRLWAVTPAG